MKAVINSALSINMYAEHKYESLILDVFGEWKTNVNSKIYNLKFYSLNRAITKLLNFSSEGFIRSRLKYIIIFLISLS